MPLDTPDWQRAVDLSLDAYILINNASTAPQQFGPFSVQSVGGVDILFRCDTQDADITLLWYDADVSNIIYGNWTHAVAAGQQLNVCVPARGGSLAVILAFRDGAAHSCLFSVRPESRPAFGYAFSADVALIRQQAVVIGAGASPEYSLNYPYAGRALLLIDNNAAANFHPNLRSRSGGVAATTIDVRLAQVQSRFSQEIVIQPRIVTVQVSNDDASSRTFNVLLTPLDYIVMH